jgi:putative endonuclease
VTRRQVGRAGEDIAAKYLKNAGFTLLEKNVDTPFGEVDLLCTAPDGTIVYCEVRAKTSTHFASTGESITPRKLQHMIRTAEYLQKRRFTDQRHRLDLICVQAGKVVDHLQNIELA